jgi:glycosyltransferase involved in cell wall biosynthesis
MNPDELEHYQKIADGRELRLRGDEAEFATGQPAEHRYGILYQGDWEAPADGTARAVRAHATALASTGLPVLLSSISHTTTDPMGRRVSSFLRERDDAVEAEIAALRRTSIAHSAILIRHAVVPSAAALSELVVSKSARTSLAGRPDLVATLYRLNILYSVWERDRVPGDIVEVMQKLGQLWVPCHQNRDMLVASGIDADRVHVVPHPFRRTHPLLGPRKWPEKTWKLFYSIGKWEPRKGYDLLIRAFLRAFRVSDRAALTLKTTAHHWPGFPSPEEVVTEALGDPKVIANGWKPEGLEKRLRILVGPMTEEQLYELHRLHNIYVCSSHGEAWCLPAFDARLASNTLVHVPYGGTADFPGLSHEAIGYRMGPVHPAYGWGDASWAVYEPAEIERALRDSDPSAPTPDPYWLWEKFGEQAVGQRMADLVLSHLDELHPAASAELRQKLRSKGESACEAIPASG